MRSRTSPIAIASIAVAMLAAGCAANAPRSEAPLPFHVAVVPIGVPSSVETDAEGVVLALDSERITCDIVDELDGRVFSRASAIDLPSSVGAEEFNAWSGPERDAWTLEAARTLEADLLLEWEVDAHSPVEHESNEKFWLNLPLFLLGGPACWFVDDQTYHVDARLSGILSDLGPVNAGRTTLQRGGSRLSDLEARVDDATLDFLDRVGGNPGQLVLSVLVPPGFLGREGARAEEALSEKVSGLLATELRNRVSDDRNRILRGERLIDFYLAADASAEWDESGLHFSGEVLERLGDGMRLDRCRIEAGGVTAWFQPGPGEPAPDVGTQRIRYLRNALAGDFPDVPKTSTARLELFAGGRNSVSRTYTLLVRPRKAPRAR